MLLKRLLRFLNSRIEASSHDRFGAYAYRAGYQDALRDVQRYLEEHQ